MTIHVAPPAEPTVLEDTGPQPSEPREEGAGGGEDPGPPVTDAAPRDRSSVSLDDLIAAYHEPERPRFPSIRDLYQDREGEIREQYFANTFDAGALLIAPPGPVARLTQRRKIHMRYYAPSTAGVQPELETVLWRARRLERTAGLVLGGRSRKVLVEMLYAIIGYLIGRVDSTLCGALDDDERNQRLQSALESAREELDSVEQFVTRAANKSSLRWYLLGFPAGVVAGAALLWLATGLSEIPGADLPLAAMTVCFACGAIGAIVSVMSRITMGQRATIDSEQGHAITLVAGFFRPLLGALFGLAIFVFVEGGIIPLAVPDGSDQAAFYAALAFLAGFSERWAQDTIVTSTPMPTQKRNASQVADDG